MKNFRGWKNVYNFTRKNACSKGYKAVTAFIALLIIGALIVVNIIAGKPPKEETKSNIELVEVMDQSGLNATDFSAQMEQLALKNFYMKQAMEENPKEDAEPFNKYSDVQFMACDASTKEEAVKMADEVSTKSVVVVITKTEAGYQMEGILPSKSEISTSDCEELLESMKECFQSNKLTQAGLTVEQLTTVMQPVDASYQSVGEDTNIATVLIKILVPMFFGLIMYFLLMLHGQTVSKSVSTEKTSKLMETLLTSIHPYALITGKILAIASIAITQFLTWVAAAVVGLYGGNFVAQAMYPDYQNSVVTVINFLRDNIGESALTLPSVILAIIIFCIGFLFYCVIAGVAGCIISKPEDVASANSLFIYPIVISWLVCYFASAAENTVVLTVARYIPFTIPFGVPVDLLTGTISLVQGIISLAILLIFSILLIMVSARIYKGLVLYNGEKISFKKVIQVIKAKQ